MSIVNFQNVRTFDVGELYGCSIDSPKAGEEWQIHAVDIRGWAVAREQSVTRIELVCHKEILANTPLNRTRKDIQERFPGVDGNPACGFHMVTTALGLPHEFELVVRAVLEDNRRLPIGVVKGTRTPLQSDSTEGMQPLMVTTLGRTGSTWLTHLLGQHPEILTYRPFQYETRVANYWMTILRTLSSPNSYLHSLATDLRSPHWWLGDRQPPARFPLPDSEIQQWLGEGSLNMLAAFCRDVIQRFYNQATVVLAKNDPAFFVEKFSPGRFLPETVAEVWPGAREIVLVRDCRDMMCSILAYNKKRGIKSFGRQFATTDEEYVQWLRNTALRLLRSWQRRSKTAHLMRYEDLIRDSENTLRSALDYLGLSSSGAVVGEMIEQALAKRTRSQQMHKTSSSHQSSIGRWQRELSPAVKAACGPAFDDVLEEFGYEQTPQPA